MESVDVLGDCLGDDVDVLHQGRQVQQLPGVKDGTSGQRASRRGEAAKCGSENTLSGEVLVLPGHLGAAHVHLLMDEVDPRVLIAGYLLRALAERLEQSLHLSLLGRLGSMDVQRAAHADGVKTQGHLDAVGEARVGVVKPVAAAGVVESAAAGEEEHKVVLSLGSRGGVQAREQAGKLEEGHDTAAVRVGARRESRSDSKGVVVGHNRDNRQTFAIGVDRGRPLDKPLNVRRGYRRNA
mmetsp:Transcript_8495/g.14613  ORF Transcript_8495/g.14613 Transcript_8495/m.14613 type:complete len:239 (+) Transcript_8495:565-1281(+)